MLEYRMRMSKAVIVRVNKWISEFCNLTHTLSFFGSLMFPDKSACIFEGSISKLKLEANTWWISMTQTRRNGIALASQQQHATDAQLSFKADLGSPGVSYFFGWLIWFSSEAKPKNTKSYNLGYLQNYDPSWFSFLLFVIGYLKLSRMSTQYPFPS